MESHHPTSGQAAADENEHISLPGAHYLMRLARSSCAWRIVQVAKAGLGATASIGGSTAALPYWPGLYFASTSYPASALASSDKPAPSLLQSARNLSGGRCRLDMQGTAAGKAEVLSKHKIELPDSTASLAQVCENLSNGLQRFLAEELENELLKGVQQQVRTALGVFEEALSRYRFVDLDLACSRGQRN